MTQSNSLHLGHMRKDFGLSPSQRQAIFPALKLNEGEILAINGPPGTGKTTLIQDILASLMIKTALDKSDPLIVVVASTGNQAVTNVIDSFSGKNKVKRWLPKPIDSLGLYLTNNSKKIIESEKKGYSTSKSDFEGFPKNIQNDVFLVKAETTYSKSAETYFGQKFQKTHNIIDALHKKLVTLQKHLKKSELCITNWLKEQNNINNHGGKIAIVNKVNELEIQEKKLIWNSQKLDKIRHQWSVHVDNEPLWISLLIWLPPVKKKQENRDNRFVSAFRQYIQIKFTSAAQEKDRQKFIEQKIDFKIKTLNKEIKILQTELNKLNNVLTSLKNAKAKFKNWIKIIYPVNNSYSNFDIESFTKWDNEKSYEQLHAKIDQIIRYELFVLATHYWEGRWIIETQAILKKPPKDDMFCYWFPNTKLQAWQRLSMLTPCFVVTLHSAPTFFKVHDGNHSQSLHVGVIDWLILDESGQVRPDIAAPTMALGKRALAVGDIKQLDPVYGITTSIDRSNAIRYEVACNNSEFVQIMAQGMSSSNGTLIQIAQTASNIGRKNYEPGVFLAHHRRCLDPIIEYCNELSYNGRIIPLRGKKKTLFPSMGYSHIKGRCEYIGKSRINLAEAETIVQWITKVKPMIEESYKLKENKKTLGDHIGIITPFKPQGELIKKLLKKEILNLDDDLMLWGYEKFKIGTVDAIQGTGRDIILFSSVYTTENKRFFMLDNKPNRLNVAISRAKDSFLLFGDMEIFNPELPKHNPRGLLARHLTQSLENVPCVPVYPRSATARNLHEICSSIDCHRDWLQQAFSDTTKKILIVSPFLSKWAIQASNIIKLIKQAQDRDVIVRIIVDKNSTTQPLQKSSTAEEAFKILENTGAIVQRANNIHTKLICVDVNYMISGSFNWLSAERTKAKNIKHDTSFKYSGQVGKIWIKQLADEITIRVIKQ